MQSPASSWRHRARLRRAGSTLVRLLVVAVPALAGATLLVGLLESQFQGLNASPVYLLPVVVAALAAGTLGALATAVAGILLYDYLFTEPFHTFVIRDAGEWLSLALLLFVGLVVGQLTALGRRRAVTAEAREREARELFQVSRALSTRESTTAVLPEIAELLRDAGGLRSLWIALGADDAGERIAALAGSSPPPGGTLHWVLRRMPGDEPARWIRIHQGGGPGQALLARRAAGKLPRSDRSRLACARVDLGHEGPPRRPPGPLRDQARCRGGGSDRPGSGA